MWYAAYMVLLVALCAAALFLLDHVQRERKQSMLYVLFGIVLAVMAAVAVAAWAVKGAPPVTQWPRSKSHWNGS